MRLPRELPDFLRCTGGADGRFAGSHVVIWSAGLLVEQKAGDLRRRFPNLLLLGSDGAHEYLGLDQRREPLPVVMLESTVRLVRGVPPSAVAGRLPWRSCRRPVSCSSDGPRRGSPIARLWECAPDAVRLDAGNT